MPLNKTTEKPQRYSRTENQESPGVVVAGLAVVGLTLANVYILNQQITGCGRDQPDDGTGGGVVMMFDGLCMLTGYVVCLPLMTAAEVVLGIGAASLAVRVGAAGKQIVTDFNRQTDKQGPEQETSSSSLARPTIHTRNAP